MSHMEGGTGIAMLSSQVCKVKFKWQTLFLFNIRRVIHGDLCTFILLNRNTFCFGGSMALGFGVTMLSGLTRAMLQKKDSMYLGAQSCNRKRKT